MAVDLNRTDIYPTSEVPDADVETALKVIRTIRGLCLHPDQFDARGAVLLSHAHGEIVNRVRIAQGQQPIMDRD